MSAAQSAPLRTMIARVSIDDIIIYANDALAAYLKTPKRHLIGSSLEEVSRLCSGEISECFARPPSGRTSNRLVSDGDGKVFEAQVYASGGTLDIVLDEIGSPARPQANCANPAERRWNCSAKRSCEQSAILEKIS